MGKYSSILFIPEIFIFCVISTAVVLQGVIISRLGPTKYPLTLSPLINFALPNSQHSAAIFSLVSCLPVSKASTEPSLDLKNRIITDLIFDVLAAQFFCAFARANLLKIILFSNFGTVESRRYHDRIRISKRIRKYIY